jgi:putative aldouronate transport system substrate-binding protein
MTVFFMEGNNLDFGFQVSGPQYWLSWFEQGLMRDFPGDWYYQYMPNAMKLVEEAYGLTKDQILRQLKLRGKYYAMPITEVGVESPGYSCTIRLDYKEAIGYTGVPVTMEDNLELYKMLTYDDPDGNGKDDTWARSNWGDYWGNFGFMDVYGAFGFMHRAFYIGDDGKVKFADIDPRMKDVIKTINLWYREGVLEPEFAINDKNTWFAKWGQGMYGIFNGPHGSGFMDAHTKYADMVWEHTPGVKFQLLPPMQGPDGHAGYRGTGRTLLTGFGHRCCGRDSTDAQVKKVMEILDGIASDPELYRMIRFGEEGRDWHWEEGYIVPHMSYYSEESQQRGIGSYPRLADRETFIEQFSRRDREEIKLWESFPRIPSGVLFPTSDVNLVFNEKFRADVQTAYVEFFNKGAMGFIDVDKEWDKYVDTLMKAGLKEILEEYERLYEEALEMGMK